MPLSKSFLFEPDLQSLADCGLVISHPARIIILRSLEDAVSSYEEICALIPLRPTTISQHLRILERSRLIKRVAYPSKIAGYALDNDNYAIAKARLMAFSAGEKLMD
ncbi:MAG: ArsR family transcriptional regulator [Bacteroidota bacterium]